MNSILAGLVARFVAVVVWSAMMVAKGIMPGLDVFAMLRLMMGATAAMGWKRLGCSAWITGTALPVDDDWTAH